MFRNDLLDEYRDLLKQGYDYFIANKFDVSMRLFNEAIMKYPRFAEAYYFKGQLYLNVNRFAESYLAFRTADNLQKDNREYRALAHTSLNAAAKIDLLDAIVGLPLRIQNNLFQECLDKKTALGKRFWKQEGLTPCSLKKGTLREIIELLELLQSGKQVRRSRTTFGIFQNKKTNDERENVTFNKGPGNSDL